MLVGRDVPVEEDPRVAGRVEAFVKVPKRPVGQVRNVLGMASRFHAVGRVRQQALDGAPLNDRLGGGIGALHLVVDDSRDRKTPLIVDFEMVALLLEGRAGQERSKDEVVVDRHEVIEVRLDLAGHRIAGAVGRGERVQEGAKRTLAQLVEGVPHRIVPGPGQGGMLQDVGHPGRIGRRRPEDHAVEVLPVVTVEMQDSRAGGQMDGLGRGGPDLRDRRHAIDPEAVRFISRAIGRFRGSLPSMVMPTPCLKAFDSLAASGPGFRLRPVRIGPGRDEPSSGLKPSPALDNSVPKGADARRRPWDQESRDASRRRGRSA